MEYLLKNFCKTNWRSLVICRSSLKCQKRSINVIGWQIVGSYFIIRAVAIVSPLQSFVSTLLFALYNRSSLLYYLLFTIVRLYFIIHAVTIVRFYSIICAVAWLRLITFQSLWYSKLPTVCQKYVTTNTLELLLVWSLIENRMKNTLNS